MKSFLSVFMLLIISISTFGQNETDSIKTLKNSYFEKKYFEYVEECTFKPWSYEKWLNKSEKTLLTDFETEYKVTNDFSNTTFIDVPPPGDYLIKGSNQMLAGIGLNVLGGIMLVSTASKNQYDDSDDENKISETTSIIGIGLCCFGFGLEVMGIMNIKHAGISLNNNGIGIKIKF